MSVYLNIMTVFIVDVINLNDRVREMRDLFRLSAMERRP